MCYLKSAESYRRYFWLDPKNIKKLVRTKIIKFLDMLHLKNPIRRLLKRRDYHTYLILGNNVQKISNQFNLLYLR